MPLILVVDDLPLNIEYLEEELMGLGYEVVGAADGEEALRRIHETRPDLVLLDLSMPKLDGIGVLEALRADPEHRRLPVILLTGRKELEDRVKGLDAGADDYITKPFHMGEVAARIRVQLRIVELQQELLDHEKRLAQAEGVGQTLVTLSHYINNATQAVSGMAQLCQADPENTAHHHQLAEIALKQSARISAVLESLQRMVDHMEVHTADYAGDPDRMLDIEADLQRRLESLDGAEGKK